MVEKHDLQKDLNLIQVFEKEFGQPLAPIEIIQINQWINDFGPLMVILALDRAALREKYHLMYIYSILLEWKNNNLTTIKAIAEYEGKKCREIKAKSNTKLRILVAELGEQLKERCLSCHCLPADGCDDCEKFIDDRCTVGGPPPECVEFKPPAVWSPKRRVKPKRPKL